jgi:hypothetical protein
LAEGIALAKEKEKENIFDKHLILSQKGIIIHYATF